MKTPSRFHRVVTFTFAAVFAAGIGVRPVEGAPASVTVMNAAGEATLSTDGETWQPSVTVEVQPGECVQVHDKAGFVRLVPAVAGTYYALSNCTGMVTDPSARTTIRPDGKTAVIFANALTSTFLPGGPCRFRRRWRSAAVARAAIRWPVVEAAVVWCCRTRFAPCRRSIRSL